MLLPVLAPPFPLDVAVTARVGIALEHALLRQGESRDDLRTAVEKCVDSLRAQGMSPEGVIITMKALVRHEAGTSSVRIRGHNVRAADYFMEEIVRWCINEYFSS